MPARTNYGSQGKQKNSGVLAGVANCGRSQKWGYGGCSRLRFKLKFGRHQGRETMRGQCETMPEEKR